MTTSIGLRILLMSCSTTLVRPSATPATCFLAPEDRRADVFRERERPDEEDGFDAAIVCLLLESYLSEPR
jgi:hypothetical protein